MHIGEALLMLIMISFGYSIGILVDYNFISDLYIIMSDAYSDNLNELSCQ